MNDLSKVKTPDNNNIQSDGSCKVYYSFFKTISGINGSSGIAQQGKGLIVYADTKPGTGLWRTEHHV